uniref:Anaphase-promoting complex subunit 4 WD40 domain-containing protein n=1 Tax=Oryza punctata TaxID=4537 RepID=A0A0E0L588_ORYPU
MAATLSQLDDEIVRGMAIGAVFTDYAGKINCLDFHRKEDLLVTSSEDDSIRLYNITSATLLKTTYHRKHGADRVCFTHHPSSILCSSRYNLESAESLRYLSLYDNRCLRYFKGHKDSFMSGSLDHSVRIWDLRVNACQGPFDTFLVGGDTAEVSDIKFSNDGKSMLLTTTNNHIYVLDAYGGDKRCGFSLESSPNVATEAAFTPDGQYVISGSGDGTLHAWNINTIQEVACWNSHIGPITALKWAPRRAMFATASTALTFWIPNSSSSN